MNILFYDTKRYDMESFDAIKDQYDKLTIDYVDTDLSVKTARLAKGYDAICAFVSSDVSAPVVNALTDEMRGLQQRGYGCGKKMRYNCDEGSGLFA